MTKIQKEYQKQKRRVEKIVKEIQSFGGKIDITLPDLKRPTNKSIAKLKSLTPKRLYSQSEFINTEGVKIDSEEFRQAVNKRKAETKKESKARKALKAQVKLPNISNIILNNVEDILNEYAQTKEDFKDLLNTLNKSINEHGRDYVARYLNQPQIAQEIGKLLDILYVTSDPTILDYSLVKLHTILSMGEISDEEVKRLSENQEAFEQYAKHFNTKLDEGYDPTYYLYE